MFQPKKVVVVVVVVLAVVVAVLIVVFVFGPHTFSNYIHTYLYLTLINLTPASADLGTAYPQLV